MSNISEHPGIKCREGTSQSMRRLTVLDPVNVRLDDRGIAELLTCAWKYAGELTYFNSGNYPDGNWQDFFTVDPVVGLAVIGTEAGDRVKRYNGYKSTKSISDLKVRLDDLFNEFKKLPRWHRLVPPQHDFHVYLKQLIKDHLASDIMELIILSKTVFEGYNPDVLKQIERWLSAEGLYPSESEKDSRSVKADEGISSRDALEKKVFLLSDSIHKTFSSIQSEAFRQMDICLKESGNHSPHVCLLLSFLSLFKDAQAQLNTVTQRHLNYYFRDLLGFDNKGGVPDKTYVLLGIAPHKKSCKLTKGTGFKAGKDARGNELTYRLEDDFTLTTAQVASVKNTFIAKKDSNEIAVCVGEFDFQNSEGGKPGDVEPSSQQLFGDESLEKASLGFVLSTPLLRLGQGNREATFMLDLKFSSADSLAAFREKCTRNDDTKDERESDWLNLDEIFSVEHTGDEGWINIEKPAVVDFFLHTRPIHLRGIVLKDSATARLKITVLLPPGRPPVSDYNSSSHEDGYESPWPAFRFTLDQNKHASLFGLLHEVKIFHCELSVNVTGMQDVIIENELGVHDPAKPFMPFGPSPHEGSAFMVGSPEIFQKNIDKLKVYWQWPDAPDDFAEYYRGYENFSNISIKPQILINGQWKQTGSGNFHLKGQGSNNFNLPDIEIAESGERFHAFPDLEHFTAYDVKLGQGFIKFEICNKGATLGQREYPELLAKSMVELPWYKEKYEFAKSLHVIEKAQKSVNINKPYTPVFQSLMIDYSASQHIDIHEADPGGDDYFKLIRVNPFGSEEVTEQGEPFLLPFYRQEAYLYIGLEDMDTPQELSLLFHLADHNGANSETKAGAIKWSYLMDNRWYDFDPSEISFDSTANLSRTGIVRFPVPDIASKTNSILPAEMRWLRASIAEGSKAVNRVLGIHSQAAQVAFSDAGNDSSHLSRPLPKGSISKTELTVKDIKSVSQPCESFAGQGPESDKQFYTRVSERLRHKDRAVNVWDYERLILHKFPEIQKVKCLPNTCKNLEKRPGEVTIVVIPKREENQKKTQTVPVADRALLDDMKKYLQSKVSPAIGLAVINPRFEKIRIEAEIRLTEKGDNDKNRSVLINTLRDFLNPGANHIDEVSFNEVFIRSDIFNLVNSMPFIDEIINLTAVHNEEKHILVSGSKFATDNYKKIHGSTQASILMSAEFHDIKYLTGRDS